MLSRASWGAVDGDAAERRRAGEFVSHGSSEIVDPHGVCGAHRRELSEDPLVA